MGEFQKIDDRGTIQKGILMTEIPKPKPIEPDWNNAYEALLVYGDDKTVTLPLDQVKSMIEWAWKYRREIVGLRNDG